MDRPRNQGERISEDRNTRAEIDPTGIGAADVGRGALHPAAQKFYAPGDVAMSHVRQARQAGQQSGAPTLSPGDNAAFNQANQHFEQSHMQTQTQTPDQGQGKGVHRGWSPQARIAAARARNVQNLPYGGDPTQAPDYVEPKK
jgi:hypothetical protein